MKQKLGFMSIVLLGINMIIGTGIFLLPASVYQQVGTHSIFLVLVTAILTICIALCFAEGAGIYTKNGGAYVYTKETLGEFPAFIVGFMGIAIGVIAWATIVNAFVITLFSTLGIVPTVLLKNIGITLFILFLTIINLLGVHFTKKVGNIITIGKLLPLLIFIGIGLFFMKPSNFENHIVVHNYSGAVLLLFYAFTGFESIAAASEDMLNPKKNLSRAILLVIGIVSIIYTFIILITIGILGGNLSNSSSPIAQAMRVIAGDFGFMFISLGALVSMFGINLANSFVTPRGITALAQDHQLPSVFGQYNEKGVPVIAIICSGLITWLIALSGSFEELVSITVIARFAQYIPTCIAIIVLRFKKPHIERHFKIPFGITLPVLGIVMCIWLLSFASARQLIIGFSGIVVAIIFYFIMLIK